MKSKETTQLTARQKLLAFAGGTALAGGVLGSALAAGELAHLGSPNYGIIKSAKTAELPKVKPHKIMTVGESQFQLTVPEGNTVTPQPATPDTMTVPEGSTVPPQNGNAPENTPTP